MTVPPRPMAPMPSHSASHRPPAAPRHPLYTPTPEELRPGPSNRLILALRSGVASEVDWALPRLVTASFDHPDTFIVGAWLDAAPALLHWPEAWLSDLERAAALAQARRSGKAGPAAAAVPEWTVDPATKRRATESLLIMRNATLHPRNAEHIGKRARLVDYILRFFALPHGFLMDTTLSTPEPILHLVMILHATLPHLSKTSSLLSLLSHTIPSILLSTRDAALVSLLLPLLITSLALPSLPALLPTLPPYLLHLTTLSPPPPIMDHTLDLLLTLTLHPGPARIILADPSISAHLRHVLRLLAHGGARTTASFAPPPWTMGSTARNPASARWAAEGASQRRAKEREAVKAMWEREGRIVAEPKLGTGQAVLADVVRRRLMGMKEPERSIQW